MENKLRKLLVQCAEENNIETQQALKYLIYNIKTICVSLNLDFDFALDKSDPTVEFISNGCDHFAAYPCGGDSVFCPKCSEYLVKGKMSGIDIEDWVKQNHWR